MRSRIGEADNGCEGVFQSHRVENYKEAFADPANFRKLWNAAISMNTVAEFLALHRAGYPATLKSGEVDEKAEAVRSEYPDLKAIKSYADN